MKSAINLIAAAIIGATLGLQQREPVDPPPPESPQPRQEVIDNSAPQESARPPQDAAEQGKARPLVNTETVEDSIRQEATRMAYKTNFDAAWQEAADTGRMLLVLIASERPPDFDPPLGVTYCWLTVPPPGWEVHQQSAAVLITTVAESGEHTTPIPLDPERLQSDLNRVLEALR